MLGTFLQAAYTEAQPTLRSFPIALACCESVFPVTRLSILFHSVVVLLPPSD